VKVSSLYETEPVGGPPGQGKYLDGAAEIRTSLGPHDLLKHLKQIELKAGRTPSDVRWAPREIDLDILLYGDMVIDDSELTVPHLLLHKRLFMIEPLAEIAPGALHPILKKTALEIMKGLATAEKR